MILTVTLGLAGVALTYSAHSAGAMSDDQAAVVLAMLAASAIARWSVWPVLGVCAFSLAGGYLGFLDGGPGVGVLMPTNPTFYAGLVIGLALIGLVAARPELLDPLAVLLVLGGAAWSAHYLGVDVGAMPGQAMAAVR